MVWTEAVLFNITSNILKIIEKFKAVVCRRRRIIVICFSYFVHIFLVCDIIHDVRIDRFLAGCRKRQLNQYQ